MSNECDEYQYCNAYAMLKDHEKDRVIQELADKLRREHYCYIINYGSDCEVCEYLKAKNSKGASDEHS